MSSPNDDRNRRSGFPVSYRALLLTLAFGLSAACSGGGGCGSCGGCDAFKQKDFPEKHYDKTVEQSGQVRLTKKGIDYLEGQVPNLIKQFQPQGLNFCVPKSSSGDINVCKGSTCNNGNPGCQLNLKLNNANIKPKPKDTLRVEAKIGGVEEDIPFEYTGLPLVDITCTLDLHKKNAGSNVPAELGVGLPIRFVIDKLSKLNNMTIKVDSASVDLSDLGFDIEGGVDCSLANAVKGLFSGQLKNQLKSQLTGTVKEMVTQQFCKTCGSQMASCPKKSSCGSKDGVDVCKWDKNDKCVSSPLGQQGRLKLGSALSDVMEPEEAKVDTIFRAADLAKVDTGLSVGLRTGFQQTSKHPCAPIDPKTRPKFDPVQPSSKILTDKQPGTGEKFMVGIGVHKRAIEHMLWSTWASGGTCLRVGSSFSDQLSTDALRLFIPSIENLASSSQPIYLRVSPQTAPKVTLGPNEIVKKKDSYKLKKPLMTINWKDLDLHFYAFIQDRYTRLYTTRVDLKVPVGLQANGMGQIVPVTGDLEKAAKNIRVRNHQLLAEKEEELKKIVPTLLGAALPQLTGSLAQPIDLPSVSGYKIVVENDDITSVDNRQFIALYADLRHVGNMQPLMAQLEPSITDVRVDAPSGTVEGVPEPTVEVELRPASSFSPNNSGNVEYSYRVDNGLWSMFHRTRHLEIDSPVLALEGEHRIQIRARVAGVPATASKPVERTVRVDYQAPEIDLDRDGRKVAFEGRDVVDRTDELSYRYRAETEDGEVLRGWTNWSDTRELDLLRLGTDQPVVLTVQARDRAGHVGSATETFPTTPSIVGAEDFDESSGSGAPEGTACSIGSSRTPPLGLLLLFALTGIAALLRRIRLRKLASVGLLGLVLVFFAGCDNDIKKGNNSCSPSCKSWETCKDGKCVAKECEADSDCSCPSGQTAACLDGVCVCKDFCPNGCGKDQYCCYPQNKCKSMPNPCKGKSCDPGYKKEVASKGTPDHKACEVSGATCECVEMEPLAHEWFGAYTSIDSRKGVTAVSTYNRAYGDLMVGIIGGDGLTPTWHYVDGVPSEGEVVAAPSGPRSGIEDEGEDVGTHTAVAVDGSGRIHVFYRNADDEKMKYARGSKSSGSYEFTTTTLRDREGSGLYTSAAIQNGTVHAVYAADGVQVTVDGKQIDGSRLLHISFPADTGVSKLSPKPETLHSAGTRSPCKACASSKRCFLDSNSCKKPTSDCKMQCAGGESCLNGNCKSIYLPPDTPAHRIMTGLYTEIVPRSKKLTVLFYDHVDRRIGWITGTTKNWDKPKFAGSPTGPYASGAVDPSGEFHLAYMEPESKTLVYQPPGGKMTEMIVDGVRSQGGEHLYSAIGEDVDLWIDSSSTPHITFQDATHHALHRGDRKGMGNWKIETLSKAGSENSYNGARGFYSATSAPSSGITAEMVINQQVEPPEAHLEFHRLK